MIPNPSASRIRLRQRRSAALLLLVPLVLAACGGDDSGGQSAAEPAAVDEVTMELIAFSPPELTIRTGGTVTWRQKDAGVHTVTSGTVEQGGAGVTQHPDDKFDSGQVATGDTFEHTFAEPGTYPYFCEIHPATMRGEILVT